MSDVIQSLASGVSRRGNRPDVAGILGQARRKGIRLWSDNGQLRYEAPKGALTLEEIERIRECRNEIVTLLERAASNASAAPPITRHHRSGPAPLAFSQLAHWNTYELGERPSYRNLATATRMRGRLNVEALRKSIADMVRRHELLRSRIAVVDGVPVQQILESVDGELRTEDLTGLPECLREPELVRSIERHMREPVNVRSDPLFRFRLLKLGDEEHVFLVSTEHLISDAYSMNILHRDLFTSYRNTLRSHQAALPEIPVQFIDYAAWLRGSHADWLREHAWYWRQHLAGATKAEFPRDRYLDGLSRSGWGTVPIRVSKVLKAQLSRWSRAHGTTLAMTVFTAYVALVLRWCRCSEVVFQYQTDGRPRNDLQHTMGYFAFVLYLRVYNHEDDSFANLLEQVTSEYCNAHEHADFSSMAAQLPKPVFTRNAAFNWVPDEPKYNIAEAADSEKAIECTPVAFPHPMLKDFSSENEPSMLLYETNEEISGGVYFARDRFSEVTMHRFASNFQRFLGALVSDGKRCVKDVTLL